MQIESRLKSNKIFRIIVLVVTVLVTCTVLSSKTIPDGYKNLFLVPALFGFYLAFSKLASYFFKSITITFFITILILRYLATPFVMCVTNNYSAMFNGVSTFTTQRATAVGLMIYELIAVAITVELCLTFIYNKKKLETKSEIKKQPYEFPNVVYVISILIGICGIIIAPKLLQGFNFLYVHKDIEIESRNMFVCILSYFLQFIQIFVFLMIVKYFTYRKKTGRGYSTFILLFLALINITFMWSANRMYIIYITGATLAVLLYAFPEKRKTFLTLLLSVMVIVVVILSSYRIFGTLGAKVDTKDYSNYFGDSNFAKQMQIYFAGPDSIAGAVAVKDYYCSLITPKTFLNDTFIAVRFIQQLPVFLNDKANATIYYYNQYCCKGYIGLIIPMVGQGYIYFGALLSPVFSVLSVVFMFLAARKAYLSEDVGYKYVFTLAAMMIAAFPALNHTIVIQNVFNTFFPLLFIVWLNRHIYFNKKYIVRHSEGIT